MVTEYFRNDPLAGVYNLAGLTDVVLTCDLDWAPDYAVETVLELVHARGFALTFFATHKSACLSGSLPGNVEVGLHPDFTRPDARDWFATKLLTLKEIYPSSSGMRSHRNFFGQNIGDLARDAGLTYDASTFLWNEPFCQCHLDYNGIARFSYMWEDGIHLDTRTPMMIDAINLRTPGLKILNVHPILIYLNSPNEDHRRSVTRRYTDLTLAPKGEIDASVYRGAGIRVFYERLLDWLAERGIRTHLLGELAAAARSTTRRSAEVPADIIPAREPAPRKCVGGGR